MCRPSPAPDTPIACSLSGRELTARRLWLSDLREHALAIAPTAEGLTGRFAAEMENELRELARAEARCCPFLTFEVARLGGVVELRVRGPALAQPIIRELFGMPAGR
jgi:hypothetical protein